MTSRAGTSLVFLALCMLLCAPSARAFDYFEHRAIGNAALAEAMRRTTPEVRALVQGAMRVVGLEGHVEDPTSPLHLVPMRFGDLAALAGDFAGDVEELERVLIDIQADTARGRQRSGRHALLTTRASALVAATREEWLAACRWLFRARALSSASHQECFDSLLTLDPPPSTQPKRLQATAGMRASRAQRAGYEQTDNYVRLAARNFTHFPQFSWMVYRNHHAQALRWARCFADEQTCDGFAGRRLVELAILHEGVAQHFLQDSFASGHIGTHVAAKGDCIAWLLGCTPTVARSQQTHDVLNEVGLEVRIDQPLPHVRPSDTARSGWTAFGDGHLFIPEADLHRAFLLQTAAESVEEVLGHFAGGKRCVMCTRNIFPVPVQSFGNTRPAQALELHDQGFAPGPLIRSEPRSAGLTSRSPDPRVPALFQEGWKLSLGYGRETLRPPDSATSEFAKALMLRLDYVHPTAPRWPSVYGFEAWSVPRRGVTYQGSLGWTWPRELSNTSLTMRLKLGWRLDDNLTWLNPSNDRRKSVELAVPFEYTYEVYPPLALFFHVNLLTYSLQDGKVSSPRTRGQAIMLGLRFDLAGIY